MPNPAVEYIPGSNIYWHLTPLNRLPRILREGLRPGKSKALGLGFEETRGKIFISDDPADCYAQFGLLGRSIKHWALLKLNLSGYAVRYDDEGFAYVTEPVSPDRILSSYRYSFIPEASGYGGEYVTIGAEGPKRFGPYKELV